MAAFTAPTSVPVAASVVRGHEHPRGGGDGPAQAAGQEEPDDRAGHSDRYHGQPGAALIERAERGGGGAQQQQHQIGHDQQGLGGDAFLGLQRLDPLGQRQVGGDLVEQAPQHPQHHRRALLGRQLEGQQNAVRHRVGHLGPDRLQGVGGPPAPLYQTHERPIGGRSGSGPERDSSATASCNVEIDASSAPIT